MSDPAFIKNKKAFYVDDSHRSNEADHFQKNMRVFYGMNTNSNRS